MKLNAITITATDLPNQPSHLVNSYTWRFGDPLPELEKLVAWLGDYIEAIKNPVGKAISGSKPIDVQYEGDGA
jgi:hypothetical protein